MCESVQNSMATTGITKSLFDFSMERNQRLLIRSQSLDLLPILLKGKMVINK